MSVHRLMCGALYPFSNRALQISLIKLCPKSLCEYSYVFILFCLSKPHDLKTLCIGLNKTGTYSLNYAFQIIGLTNQGASNVLKLCVYLVQRIVRKMVKKSAQLD